MPHHHCYVPLCVNDSIYDPSLSFHCFPGDPETRKIWIQKIRRDPGKFFNITVPDQIGTLSQVGTKKISKGGWTI